MFSVKNQTPSTGRPVGDDWEIVECLGAKWVKRQREGYVLWYVLGDFSELLLREYPTHCILYMRGNAPTQIDTLAEAMATYVAVMRMEGGPKKRQQS
jgi:hypothetical protein